MGAKFTENFSRANTQLIMCKSSDASAKAQKAMEWGIPILSDSWIYECLANVYLIDEEYNGIHGYVQN